MGKREKKPLSKQQKGASALLCIGGLLMLVGYNLVFAGLFIVGGAVLLFTDKDN